ncbi:Uncharacterised protein [Vibrio cholerae]|nr:Uncharacterised protein [Vibrio cholerae]
MTTFGLSAAISSSCSAQALRSLSVCASAIHK